MEVNRRINRIIGQLRGIEKMVNKRRKCEDILQQMAAVKKAIDGLSKKIIVSDVCRFIPPGRLKKIEKLVKRAISL